MAYDMNDLLELMVDQRASDLHLQVGQPPTLRLSGSMTPIEGPALTPADTEQLMLAITPDSHQQGVKLNGGADFGFAYSDKARFRVSVLKAKGSYGMVLRQIPNKMFSLREIGLPDKIRELLYRPRGLILVTGPTGSGKSTTLASMINYVNENRDGHIITIEDPIEYYHPHKRCLVTQREVHADVPSFSPRPSAAPPPPGLPDIILVGEIRCSDLGDDRGPPSATRPRPAILVFGTPCTPTAPPRPSTASYVDAFPANMKEMIRTQLATSVVAVISQVLCKKIGGGRIIAAYEIMITTNSIAAAHPRKQDLPHHLRYPDRRQSRHDHDGHAPHEPRQPRADFARRSPRKSAGSRRHARKVPRFRRQAAPDLILHRPLPPPPTAFAPIPPMFESHDHAILEICREKKPGARPATLNDLNEEHKATGKPLGRPSSSRWASLHNRRFLLKAIAEHLGYPYMDELPPLDIPGEVDRRRASLQPRPRMYGVIPIRLDGQSIEIAASDPFNNQIIDDLTFALGKDVRIVMSDPTRIERPDRCCTTGDEDQATDR